MDLSLFYIIAHRRRENETVCLFAAALSLCSECVCVCVYRYFVIFIFWKLFYFRFTIYHFVFVLLLLLPLRPLPLLLKFLFWLGNSVFLNVASKSGLLFVYTWLCSNELDSYLLYYFLLSLFLSKAHNHPTKYYILWLCQANSRFTKPQNVQIINSVSQLSNNKVWNYRLKNREAAEKLRR